MSLGDRAASFLSDFRVVVKDSFSECGWLVLVGWLVGWFRLVGWLVGLLVDWKTAAEITGIQNNFLCQSLFNFSPRAASRVSGLVLRAQTGQEGPRPRVDSPV